MDTDGNGVESHGGWMKGKGFRWSVLIVCLELTSSISCMECMVEFEGGGSNEDIEGDIGRPEKIPRVPILRRKLGQRKRYPGWVRNVKN